MIMNVFRATMISLLMLSSSSADARPVRFPIPGFNAAYLVAPRGAGPRPVVVALHGNYDRPQWICEAFDELVEGRAWLLCPGGIPRKDTPKEAARWTFPGRRRVMKELETGLKTLKERYPDRVQSGPVLLTGFSLGAIYSARFAVAAPARFPRLYLVEGSHKVWTHKNIRRFAAKGGKEVLFACGRKGCGAQSRRLCKVFKARGVKCHEVTTVGLGHSYTHPLTTKALPLFRALLGAAEPPKAVPVMID